MSTPGRGSGGGGGGKKPHTHKVNHADDWCTEDLVILEDENRRGIHIKEKKLGVAVERAANEVSTSGGTLEFHITYDNDDSSGRVENAMCPC